tara:strand:+ start:687 stop:1493 length:807 start_codon:yes stop_codon:yes gene_type:complete
MQYHDAYSAQQDNIGTNQQLQHQQVVWSLSAFCGVRGFFDVAGYAGEEEFVRGMQTERDIQEWLDHDDDVKQRVTEMAADVSAMGGSARSVYQQDYRYLPYTLRNGAMQALSRWNMQRQRLTVSRVQCEVRVGRDGTATLASCGKGPTLWRAWGGPWNALYQGGRHALSHGDQLSLDWQEPEGAVFTCSVEPDYYAEQQQQQQLQQLATTVAGYAQQGYHPQPVQAQGSPPAGLAALPAGWSTAVDPTSGTVYYVHTSTGHAQWQPPQ